MKNKKGFTIIELLATITVLAILSLIAYPAYNFTSKKVKQQSYENKVAYVLAKAENWAFDTEEVVTNIGNLIDLGYLEPDNEFAEFKNPIDDSDMRCLVVRVQKIEDRYEAYLTGEENCDFNEISHDNSAIELIQIAPDNRINPSGQWTKDDIHLKVQFKETNEYGTNFKEEYENYVTEIRWYSNGVDKTIKINNANPFSNNNTLSLNVIQLMNTNYQAMVTISKNGVEKVYTASTIVRIDKQKPLVYTEDSDMQNWNNNINNFKLIATDYNGSGIAGYYFQNSITTVCPTNKSLYTTENVFENLTNKNATTYLACTIDTVGNISDPSIVSKITFIDYLNNSQSIRSKFSFSKENNVEILTPYIQNYPNHTPLGWTTNSNGYTVGTMENTAIVVRPPKTYYALYNHNIKIHYDGDGGSQINDTIITTIFNSSGKIKPANATISSEIPTRYGYRFLGWAQEKDGEVLYQPGATITSLTSDITLYAKWERISHKVTYNYQENGGESADVSSSMVIEGEKVNLNVKAKKNGWTFVGWSTSKTSKTPMNSLTMGESDITLYAIYKKDIVITYVDYNGSSQRTRKDPKTIYNKETSANMKTLTQGSYDGYCESWDKEGWSTSKDARNNISYGNGGTYAFSNSLTLYAIYYYDLYFIYDYNAGTYTSDANNEHSYKYFNASGNRAYTKNGSSYHSYSEPLTYTKTIESNMQRSGWRFSGWYVPGHSGYKFAGYSITYDCAIMISAQWQK